MPINEDFKNVREYTVHKRYEQLLEAIDTVDDDFTELMNDLAALFDQLYLIDSRDRTVLDITDKVGPLHDLFGETFATEFETLKNRSEFDTKDNESFGSVLMKIAHDISTAQGK